MLNKLVQLFFLSFFIFLGREGLTDTSLVETDLQTSKEDRESISQELRPEEPAPQELTLDQDKDGASPEMPNTSKWKAVLPYAGTAVGLAALGAATVYGSFFYDRRIAPEEPSREFSRELELLLQGLQKTSVFYTDLNLTGLGRWTLAGQFLKRQRHQNTYAWKNTRDPKLSKILQAAQQVCVMVPENFDELAESFLKTQSDQGFQVFKKPPAHINRRTSFDINRYITRLITKRPYAFSTEGGQVLRLQLRGEAMLSREEYLAIFHRDRYHPEYLNSNEMPLAALLGISSPQIHFDQGNRCTSPRARAASVMIGWVDNLPLSSLVTAFSQTWVNPAAEQKSWMSFYSLKGQRWKGPLNEDRSTDLREELYLRSFQSSALTHLTEAADRGSPEHKSYLRISGVNRGAWAGSIGSDQANEYRIRAYIRAFHRLSAIRQASISTLHFLDVPRIILTQAQQHEPQFATLPLSLHLQTEETPVPPEELLVHTYAWDAHSFAGNESWNPMTPRPELSITEATSLSELHNPEINPFFLHTSNTGERVIQRCTVLKNADPASYSLSSDPFWRQEI